MHFSRKNIIIGVILLICSLTLFTIIALIISNKISSIYSSTINKETLLLYSTLIEKKYQLLKDELNDKTTDTTLFNNLEKFWNAMDDVLTQGGYYKLTNNQVSEFVNEVDSCFTEMIINYNPAPEKNPNVKKLGEQINEFLNLLFLKNKQIKNMFVNLSQFYSENPKILKDERINSLLKEIISKAENKYHLFDEQEKKLNDDKVIFYNALYLELTNITNLSYIKLAFKNSTSGLFVRLNEENFKFIEKEWFEWYKTNCKQQIEKIRSLMGEYNNYIINLNVMVHDLADSSLILYNHYNNTLKRTCKTDNQRTYNDFKRELFINFFNDSDLINNENKKIDKNTKALLSLVKNVNLKFVVVEDEYAFLAHACINFLYLFFTKKIQFSYFRVVNHGEFTIDKNKIQIYNELFTCLTSINNFSEEIIKSGSENFVNILKEGCIARNKQFLEIEKNIMDKEKFFQTVIY